MCLQSRRINHTGHSHSPKIEMLVKYFMYLEHSNIIFVQNNNNKFPVKIMLIMIIITIIILIIIIIIIMRGLSLMPKRLLILIMLSSSLRLNIINIFYYCY